MDKILQYEYIKKTRTIKEATRKDILNKINELVGGYNELYADLTHQIELLTEQMKRYYKHLKE